MVEPEKGSCGMQDSHDTVIPSPLVAESAVTEVESSGKIPAHQHTNSTPLHMVPE